VILSMYGGSFSTIPAYIADLFGTQNVGAIHGCILTAWSTAGVIGTSLVSYIREYQIAHGVAKAQAYDVTMYVLAGLIVAGLICNALVRPINARYFMNETELASERRMAHERSTASAAGGDGHGGSAVASNPAVVMMAWGAVGIPLAIGIWITLQKAAVLFK
jgi:hypothetical protein